MKKPICNDKIGDIWELVKAMKISLKTYPAAYNEFMERTTNMEFNQAFSIAQEYVDFE